MASRIQGITVEIGGDTTKLSKALECLLNKPKQRSIVKALSKERG